MSSRVILLHSDLLTDRGALAAALPSAWANVLTTRHGGSAEGWQHAYETVADDWESYWADLDVSGDESLAQWREGRWRVVRAWFRLTGFDIPEIDQISYFLDGLMELVGAQTIKHPAQMWRSEAVALLDAFAGAHQTIAIVDPYAPAAMLRGMLVACQSVVHRPVIGPDELGQVGLEGITWDCLAELAEAEPETMQFVTPHLMRGGNIIPPPARLSELLSLVEQDTY